MGIAALTTRRKRFTATTRCENEDSPTDMAPEAVRLILIFSSFVCALTPIHSRYDGGPSDRRRQADRRCGQYERRKRNGRSRRARRPRALGGPSGLLR